MDALLRQAEWVREDTNAITVTPWIFAYAGLTAEAEDYAASKGVFWSDLADFNGLLVHVGLRGLPEL